MALADTARLIASLDLKGNFNAQLRANEKALGAFETRLDRTQSRSFRAGQQIGTGIKRGAYIAAGAIGFLTANIAVGLKSLAELETVTTQTNAVIASTKGVAGQTAESIRNLAEKYEALNATIDDKVIQSAENVLLTFTAVRKQAFEPAIAAALDMSTALGTDLQGSVIQIGKALQDPIKGITALRRAGVNFSTDQQKVIKRLVETGQVEKAQTLILKELNKEFGGSFIAQGNTTAGKVAKFKDAIEDLQKALANALLPTIGKVADGLTKFLADPKVVKGISDLGVKIASLFSDKNLAAGGRFLTEAFETAKSAAPVVEQAAKATFGLVQAAVGLFRSLPPEIQKLAIGAFAVNKVTGGLVTNIAGGIIETVGKQFLQRGGTPANPLFVVDVTGGLGKVAAAGGGAAAAAAGGGAAAAALPIAVIAASIAGPIIAQQKISSNLQIQAFNDVTNRVQAQIAGGSTLAELQTSLAAVDQGINEIQANPLNVLVGGQALDELRKNHDALTNQINLMSDTHSETVGIRKAAEANSADTRSEGAAIRMAIADQTSATKASGESLAAAIEGLKRSSKPADVEAAIRKGLAQISKGRGSLDATKALIAGLKAQLKNTHDPKLQASLKAAINKVEARLPARTFAAQQLRKADQLIRDGKVTRSDLKTIAGIEKALIERGLPHAASVISKAVAEARKEQTAASDRTTEAVRGLSTRLGGGPKASFAPTGATGGGGASGGLPSGSGSIFVPDVTLDPSAVTDLREATAAAFRVTAAMLARRTEAAENRVARAALGTTQAVNALTKRGLPHAASLIRERIATAQHAQVEASRWAGSATSSAIRAKKWQFTTNVTVNTEVSIKNQIRREHQLARVSATAS